MNYKQSIISITMFACQSLALAQENVADVFVLAGQSNMQGFKSDALHYPEDTEGFDKQIPFYLGSSMHKGEGRTWETMRAQRGRFHSGHFGPEVTFSRCMAAQGVKPFVIKFAYGNTSLADHWKGPGDRGLYEKLKLTVEQATEDLKARGYAPKIRGLVWIQGESDAKKPEDAQAYGQRLSEIIKDFRFNVSRDLNTPVLIGVDEEHPDVKKNQQVVQAQKWISSEEINISFTSMRGLAKADETHLLPNGVADHGMRVCEDFLALESCRTEGGKGGKCVAGESRTEGKQITRINNVNAEVKTAVSEKQDKPKADKKAVLPAGDKGMEIREIYEGMDSAENSADDTQGMVNAGGYRYGVPQVRSSSGTKSNQPNYAPKQQGQVIPLMMGGATSNSSTGSNPGGSQSQRLQNAIDRASERNSK